MTTTNFRIDSIEGSCLYEFEGNHSMLEPSTLLSISEESSKEDKKKPPIKDDKDSTGAGGQTSPDNEKPPNKN